MCPVCGQRRLVVRSSAAGVYEFCPNCLTITGRPRKPEAGGRFSEKKSPGA
ncbi:MAG TPA: hypothetical protein VMY37_15110 [Thermoguttaceae bacterium]|nr:hypothetical protein [Thermoguttaceae bacterium]